MGGRYNFENQPLIFSNPPPPPQNFYFIFSFTKTHNMEFFLISCENQSLWSNNQTITKHNPQKCVLYTCSILYMFYIKIPVLANFKLLSSNNQPYSDKICCIKHVFQFKINAREIILNHF